MRAHLIYNPNSGGIEQITETELLDGLRAAGFDPVYQSTSRESDLDAVLESIEGLVVVVGGDGTLRAVATRLIGKGVPLAILPAGTANNIWRTFSVQASPDGIIAGLKEPVRRYFDIGHVRFPAGEDYFLEAFGFGLYADILHFYEPEKGKSVTRSITALVQALSNPRPHGCRISLDGEDITGDYLLFEVLNTTAMGPRIKLAPDADPGDGLFEIVRIREENRNNLLTYISGLLVEELEELPGVEVSRGSRLEIICEDAFPFHVDAEIRPKTAERPTGREPAEGVQPDFPRTEGRILVNVLHRALELWLPKVEEASLPASKQDSPFPASLPLPSVSKNPL